MVNVNGFEVKITNSCLHLQAKHGFHLSAVVCCMLARKLIVKFACEIQCPTQHNLVMRHLSEAVEITAAISLVTGADCISKTQETSQHFNSSINTTMRCVNHFKNVKLKYRILNENRTNVIQVYFYSTIYNWSVVPETGLLSSNIRWKEYPSPLRCYNTAKYIKKRPYFHVDGLNISLII